MQQTVFFQSMQIAKDVTLPTKKETENRSSVSFCFIFFISLVSVLRRIILIGELFVLL